MLLEPQAPFFLISIKWNILLHLTQRWNCVLNLSLQTSEKKFTLLRSWHNMLFVNNTSNKTNPIYGQFFQKVTLLSLPKIGRWREKGTNANCHSQRFVLKVQGMIQEQLKVFSKRLFINPVGGVTPSGTHVQLKIYCSGSILKSKQVYFYPFKILCTKLQGHKCLR